MSTHQLKVDKPYTLVVGLGDTGLSVVRYLSLLGESIVVTDSRDTPPGIDTLKRDFPEAITAFGKFDNKLFSAANRIILSPGVAPQHEAVNQAVESGVELLGDIELFARNVNAPLVAITGSNGKSTVTSLVGEMAKADGIKVAVGGNIGTPALDLLQQDDVELYVLELSSFQLEVTTSLTPDAAVVLNISDDHLDRHLSIENYASIKQKIYQQSRVKVINVDDPIVRKMASYGSKVDDELIRYELNTNSRSELHLHTGTEGSEIIYQGRHLISCNDIKMPGMHNVSNAMAATALAFSVGISKQAVVNTLKSYGGLSHRCQWIADKDGVDWYDDSKGTNVGATVAAIDGLPQKKIVLIAGGQGKGADFTLLAESIVKRGRCAVLIGEDADKIASAINGRIHVVFAESMIDAVQKANEIAKEGDAVLLSPSCASFDMFNSYIDRGLQYQKAVMEVLT